MKKFLFVWYAVALFTSCGCGATEATRRVNVHDRLAAQWIAEKSTDPAIDEAAFLIVAGSSVLEAELGSPEKPPTAYDPKQQREDIETAKKEIESKAGFIDSVFDFLSTGAGKVSAALGLGALGITIVGWTRTALWSGKLWQFAKAAGAVIEQSKELKAQVTEKGVVAGATAAIQKVVDALPTQKKPEDPPPPPG